MKVIHEFQPVYNNDSRVLILGSIPSVKSREQRFYYGHPQNRFWKLIAQLCNASVPRTIEEKKLLCFENNIALWDVIESCEITGSSDSSIKNVRMNDLDIIFNECDIRKVFLNGAAAYKYFKSGVYKNAPEAVRLPSTSPANAAYSFDRLLKEWSIIKQYLL